MFEFPFSSISFIMKPHGKRGKYNNDPVWQLDYIGQASVSLVPVFINKQKYIINILHQLIKKTKKGNQASTNTPNTESISTYIRD